MTLEIIFEVREGQSNGGYTAAAVGHDLVAEGETLEALRKNVREAVKTHFARSGTGSVPLAIRLHIVRDEVLDP